MFFHEFLNIAQLLSQFGHFWGGEGGLHVANWDRAFDLFIVAIIIAHLLSEFGHFRGEGGGGEVCISLAMDKPSSNELFKTNSFLLITILIIWYFSKSLHPSSFFNPFLLLSISKPYFSYQLLWEDYSIDNPLWQVA